MRPKSGMRGALSFGPERPGEAAAIGELLRAVFGGPDEAKLVDGLRDGGHAIASLVARIGDEAAGYQVVGHLMMSAMAVTVDGRAVPAAALAPLAVAEGFRGVGIGGRLVEMGLEAARQHGVHAALVLGDAAYYRPFGFDAATIAHLRTPFAAGALMALELVTGALAGRGGSVGYPPPFGLAR